MYFKYKYRNRWLDLLDLLFKWKEQIHCFSFAFYSDTHITYFWLITPEEHKMFKFLLSQTTSSLSGQNILPFILNSLFTGCSAWHFQKPSGSASSGSSHLLQFADHWILPQWLVVSPFIGRMRSAHWIYSQDVSYYPLIPSNYTTYNWG